MRRPAEIFAAVLGFFAVASGSTFLQAAEPKPERRAALINLLEQDCGSCHGLSMKGGIGKPLLASALEGKDDATLVEIILNGVPRTPMPPWSSELSREEAEWLVRQLRTRK